MVLTSSSGAKIIYPDQKIETVPRSTKVKSSLVTLSKVGGFTVLSAFIPVLHFVLVPIGVVLTASMSYAAYKRNYDLKNLEIHCPHCDKKSQADVTGSELPLRTFCRHCRHMVYLNN